METIKDCLQPKDQNPDNRSNRWELQKINEFSVDKSLLTEDNKTYEDFQTILEKQKNGFLKKFFDYKINEHDQTQQNQLSDLNQLDSVEYKIFESDIGNTASQDGKLDEGCQLENLFSKIRKVIQLIFCHVQ